MTDGQQRFTTPGVSEPDPWSAATHPVPQAFLDAGDLPWPKLAPVLRRALEDLDPGDLLELATGDTETMQALAVWCDGARYTVVHREPRDGAASFWVRRA